MPAIRSVLFKHPQTGADGLWFWLTAGPGLVGQDKTQITALVPGGSVATRLQRFQTALNAALQRLCEVWTPDAQIAVDDPVRITPEVGCRWESGYYVQRIVEVIVSVLSISPMIIFGAIEVSEAASRSVYV